MVQYDETPASKNSAALLKQINRALKCLEAGENTQARNELESALTIFEDNCTEYGANIVLATQKKHCVSYQDSLDQGELIEAY